MLARTVKRYLIAPGIAVFLIALYAALGFWAVPHFLRSGVTDFVATHYHRKVTVGEIRFNPFTFVLDIKDFSLPDADGAPMVAFAGLHVDMEARSLIRLAPSFRVIELDRPQIRTVIRRDGSLNLADLGKGFASETPATPPPKPAEPMRLFIDRFAVIAGASSFEDLTHASPFRAQLQPIAFELHNFSTRLKTGAAGNDYALTAASPEGERLDWSGTFLLDPISSHGTFAVTDLQVATIWRYLQQPLPLEIPSGVIGIKGEYDFVSAGDAPTIKVDVHDTTLTNLKVRPVRGTLDYVVLGKLDVQETKVDVAQRAVEIGKVSLSGGEINAWLSHDGKLNLLELAAPAAAAAPGASAASSAPPTVPSGGAAPSTETGAKAGAAWTVAVPDISVEGFRIAAEDRQTVPAIAVVLNPLDIHVAGYSTKPDARLDITAHTTINNGATLKATAQLAPSGNSDITAHLDLAQLDLTMLQPIIAQRTAMTLVAGRLGTQLDIKKSANGALAVQGDVAVAGLRSVDELNQSFIKWKDLKLAGLQYGTQPAGLRINTITAQEPYARVIIAPDRTVNVSEVLAGPKKGAPSMATQLGAANAKGEVISVAHANADVDVKGKAPTAGGKTAPSAVGKARPPARSGAPSDAKGVAAEAAPQDSGTALPISIGMVKVINGSANYADFWIKPNFAVGIQMLNGTIAGLSSDPKSRARIKLEGKVDRYAPVSIGGEMNLLAATVYSDVKMSFKGLELTTMTPYSGHFAGYKIDKGKLSVELSYKVEQRKLTAEQHFVIDQLQLGEKVDSPEAVHLPLKLAIALLKDRNGVIDLPLPITGSLDDPQFKVGPIIWMAFVHVIEKVALAPFAALGHLFGGHGEEMKYVDFDPGSAALDDASKEKLGSLTKALQDKAQLELDVPIVFSPDLDRPALARKRLDALLAARAAAADKSGKKAAEKLASAAAPAQLTDPLQHYRLLLAEYQAELGKDADLPDSVQAIQKARGKKDAPPVESAIPDLEAALVAHIEVPDVQLQELGKRRTRAIQDVLLAEGGIDASRVFIINGTSQSTDNGKVRLEMNLK